MSKFKNIKRLFKSVINNWKTKYTLVIKNDSTHAERVSFILTPQNLFVIIGTSTIFLIFITVLLISVTPLKYYIPGYTTQEEYQLYKGISKQIDSVELMVHQNQEYIDNFQNVMNDNLPDEDLTNSSGTSVSKVSEKERNKDNMAANEQIEKEAELILSRGGHLNEDISNVPIAHRANIATITLFPPAIGTIINEYNLSNNHFGIDIQNNKNTLITAVADGVVIFAGFDPDEGNIIMIQHPGNIISIYKHNDLILKSIGTKVKMSDPIAKMGNSGFSENNSTHLHFELWYNGFPVNPLDYIVIK